MKTLLLLLAFAVGACAQPAFPTNVFISVPFNAPDKISWTTTDTNPVSFTVLVSVQPRKLATNEGGGISIVNVNASFETTTTNLSTAAWGTGTFYVSIIATRPDGRYSDPSDEARIVLPVPRPARPSLPRVAMLRVSILRTDDPEHGPWVLATNFPPLAFVAYDPHGFYKTSALEIELGPNLSNGH